MVIHIQKIPVQTQALPLKGFIFQRLHTKAETASVIQNVQRMAANAVGKSKNFL